MFSRNPFCSHLILYPASHLLGLWLLTFRRLRLVCVCLSSQLRLMPRVPGTCCLMPTPASHSPTHPAGGGMGELALGNPVNGGQRFILHNSTP